MACLLTSYREADKLKVKANELKALEDQDKINVGMELPAFKKLQGFSISPNKVFDVSGAVEETEQGKKVSVVLNFIDKKDG